MEIVLAVTLGVIAGLYHNYTLQHTPSYFIFANSPVFLPGGVKENSELASRQDDDSVSATLPLYTQKVHTG